MVSCTARCHHSKAKRAKIASTANLSNIVPQLLHQPSRKERKQITSQAGKNAVGERENLQKHRNRNHVNVFSERHTLSAMQSNYRKVCAHDTVKVDCGNPAEHMKKRKHHLKSHLITYSQNRYVHMLEGRLNLSLKELICLTSMQQVTILFDMCWSK